jgi:hypothetical protein
MDLELQSNQGSDKKWLLNTVGCLRQLKIRTKCQFRTYLNWLFKTGGIYSQVAAKAGLTVVKYQYYYY